MGLLGIKISVAMTKTRRFPKTENPAEVEKGEGKGTSLPSLFLDAVWR